MATTPSIQGLQRTPFLDADGKVSRQWINFFNDLLGIAGSPSQPGSVDGLFTDVAVAQVDESGAFGETVIIQQAAVGAGSQFLTFSVPGSLQQDPNPARVSIMPSDQSAPSGFIAEVGKPDPAADLVVLLRRTPRGATVPDLIITLTVQAGQMESAIAGGSLIFPAMSTADIVIASCSGTGVPVNLSVRPA